VAVRACDLLTRRPGPFITVEKHNLGRGDATMGLAANIRRDMKFAGGLYRLLKRIKPITLDSDVLVCDDIEEAVDKFPDNVALEDETRRLTYRELDALANRYAHWAKARNLKRSDVIALVMHNRVEYLAAWFGFSKVGVATALINTNLTGQALAHCLTISNAFNVVTDQESWRAVEEARPFVDRNLMSWVHGLADEDETNDRRDIDNAVRSASSVRPDKSLRQGLTNRDTALFIFTSGTTGLPKAARIPHSRARTYMRAFAGATASTTKDALYNCLPLYHSTGGLVGVGSILLNGGRVVISPPLFPPPLESLFAKESPVFDGRCAMCAEFTFAHAGHLLGYGVMQVNAPRAEASNGAAIRGLEPHTVTKDTRF